MALDPSNSSNFEQLALKGLVCRSPYSAIVYNVIGGFALVLYLMQFVFFLSIFMHL